MWYDTEMYYCARCKVQLEDVHEHDRVYHTGQGKYIVECGDESWVFSTVDEIDTIIYDTITRFCNERDIPTGPMFFLTDRIVFALEHDYVLTPKKKREGET